MCGVVCVDGCLDVGLLLDIELMITDFTSTKIYRGQAIFPSTHLSAYSSKPQHRTCNLAGDTLPLTLTISRRRESISEEREREAKRLERTKK